jgi:hypothetical protein
LRVSRAATNQELSTKGDIRRKRVRGRIRNGKQQWRGIERWNLETRRRKSCLGMED